MQYGFLEELYPNLGSEFDYTFVNEGAEVYFFPVSLADQSQISWEVERLTGPNLPDRTTHIGPMCEHVFEKRSADKAMLYELYRVRFLPTGSIASDSITVHVFPQLLGGSELCSYPFNDPILADNPAYADGYGRHKVTSYPSFSGNGNSRSDVGKFREGVSDNCVYTAYYSNEELDGPAGVPREGTGCLNVWCPSTDEIEVPDRGLDYHSCGGASFSGYDLCGDPCDLAPYRIGYEAYPHPKMSRSAKTELNIYANQLQGQELFYGFSFKISEDFDEVGMTGENGELTAGISLR